MSTLSPIPPGPLTVAEFLDWAAKEDVDRVELVDGEVVAMAGGTKRHARAKRNVDDALSVALEKASPHCASFLDDVSVQVGEKTIYYPDVVVDCDGNTDLDARQAGEPVIVVEVLSKTTAGYDRGAKLADYFRVPSIVHYLIVDAVRQRIIHHRRKGEEIATSIAFDGALTLDPPGIIVDIADFWRGLGLREDMP